MDLRRFGVVMVPFENVLDMIGNTPMVDVSRLSPNPDVRIIAKLEGQNPFGSVKDRIAKSMIEAAEKDGRLASGQTILEPSSGNTGIALAAIAQIKGYPIKILMPESVSIERRQMLEVYGAEIILTPGPEGSNGAVRRAQALSAEHPEWCFLYQYGNDANPGAHYETTGPEIWRDCPEITHFVAGLGTSGTFVGTSRRLRQFNPAIRMIFHILPRELGRLILVLGLRQHAARGALRVVERSHPKVNPEDLGHVGAPTAGLVSSIAVQINHPVERGAKLLTLEAMKMQSNIYAPITGRITKLLVTPGQHVEAKDLLVTIAP
jgi:hypothetical protein